MDALFIAIYEIGRKILLDKISKLIIIRNLFYSILEPWPSGRRHFPAKEAYEQTLYRGFESLRLRQITKLYKRN